jgi:histidinol-phosphate/aromatic aminotransferase/cobyric acid decarboxylase-like protein
MCGNGSDELLSLLAHDFLRLGDEGPYSQYGIDITLTVGNFLLLRFSDDDRRTATNADAYLSTRGFVLRAVGACRLRLTIGDEDANHGVVAALAEFMRGDRD